jgi:hypothetical protein
MCFVFIVTTTCLPHRDKEISLQFDLSNKPYSKKLNAADNIRRVA